MEENVTIQHHESLIKQSSCHPEGVHAVRLGIPGVLNVSNRMPTSGSDAIGLAAHYDNDVVHAREPERLNLSLEKSQSAHLDQALRLVTCCAVEPRSLARARMIPRIDWVPSLITPPAPAGHVGQPAP